MTDQPRTIRELVGKTTPWLDKKGVDSARTDTELLVAHALGMKRFDLYLDWDRPLTDDEIARCRALVLRRGQREPVALIVGHKEFYGFPFVVTKDTLVPRPETEHLVELVLARVPKDATGTFVDVCTGTGCIALAILKHRPGLTAVASDVSAAALAVAADNAQRLGVAERVRFCEGDLLAPCADVTDALFVVANPPYIRSDEADALAPEVAAHEPRLALFGEGDDALGHHRRILANAAGLVVTGGFVALEIGAGQGPAALALATAPWSDARLVQDLARLDRILVVTKH